MLRVLGNGRRGFRPGGLQTHAISTGGQTGELVADDVGNWLLGSDFAGCSLRTEPHHGAAPLSRISRREVATFELRCNGLVDRRGAGREGYNRIVSAIDEGGKPDGCAISWGREPIYAHLSLPAGTRRALQAIRQLVIAPRCSSYGVRDRPEFRQACRSSGVGGPQS